MTSSSINRHRYQQIEEAMECHAEAGDDEQLTTVAIPSVSSVPPQRPPHIRSFQKYQLDIFARDGFRCQYCGMDLLRDVATFYAATIDHVWPRSKGGSGEPANLVACCSGCNALKANYPATSLAEARGYVAGRRAEFSSYLVKLLEYHGIPLPANRDRGTTFQRDILHALGLFSGQAVQILRQMRELDDWAQAAISLVSLSTAATSPFDSEPTSEGLDRVR